MDTIINGYRLDQTCGACPEQYNVYDAQGSYVGYLRLRNGYFYAQHNDEIVYYSNNVKGDGLFDSASEREYFLTKAINAIHEKINGYIMPPMYSLWAHNKNKQIYRVIGSVVDKSDNDIEKVLYELYELLDDNQNYCRSLSDFYTSFTQTLINEYKRL